MTDAGKSDVKITVIKKLSPKDVFGDNLPWPIAGDPSRKCSWLNEGDEFIISGKTGGCPEGFCGWAFADIQRDITHLRLGGSYPWQEPEGKRICCCTDGLRPVFFKLERVS